jgi:hypothetical protein
VINRRSTAPSMTKTGVPAILEEGYGPGRFAGSAPTETCAVRTGPTAIRPKRNCGVIRPVSATGLWLRRKTD